MRNYFLSDVFGLLLSKILLLRQHDVTTSLYTNARIATNIQVLCIGYEWRSKRYSTYSEQRGHTTFKRLKAIENSNYYIVRPKSGHLRLLRSAHSQEVLWALHGKISVLWIGGCSWEVNQAVAHECNYEVS